MSKRLEVHWITYPLDGQEGWATVSADDYSDFIFYGPNELDRAAYQARLSNRYRGAEEEPKVVGADMARLYRYKAYQWMD